MVRVSALYASQDDAWFDFEYYRNKHFPMVLELLAPFGALRFEVDRGLVRPDGSKTPYVAAGHLIVESIQGLGRGLDEQGGRMAVDVKNFTNISAQLQVSEIIP